MFSLSTSEIFVILIVALVVFGKRLPEVARSVGKVVADFRRGLAGLQRDFQDEVMREDRPPAAPSQDGIPVPRIEGPREAAAEGAAPAPPPPPAPTPDPRP